MTALSLRKILYGAALLIALTGLSASCWLVLVPLPTESADDLDVAVEPVRQKPKKVPAYIASGIVQFQSVWGKRLQGPLVDPPKPAPIEKVVEQPKVVEVRFEGKLLGTLVDHDSSLARAWINTKDQRKLVRIGDQLQDVAGAPTVTRIEPQQLQLQYGSESLWIQLDRPSLEKEPEVTSAIERGVNESI